MGLFDNRRTRQLFNLGKGRFKVQSSKQWQLAVAVGTRVGAEQWQSAERICALQLHTVTATAYSQRELRILFRWHFSQIVTQRLQLEFAINKRAV